MQKSPVEFQFGKKYFKRIEGLFQPAGVISGIKYPKGYLNLRRLRRQTGAGKKSNLSTP
jgi:hypothetical protein